MLEKEQVLPILCGIRTGLSEENKFIRVQKAWDRTNWTLNSVILPSFPCDSTVLRKSAETIVF